MKVRIFLGPPGTGKTTRLLKEVDALFKKGYSPNQIAFVSFTKKAANEAKERALAKFSQFDAGDFVFWSTIHSLCFKKLGLTRNGVMQRAHWLDVGEKTGFHMTGSYDMSEGYFKTAQVSKGDRCLFHYGKARAMKLAPKDYYENVLDFDARCEMGKNEFLYFIQTLEAYKNACGLTDFTDMLERAAKTGPVRGIKVAIIDEAQDLSLLQWDVVKTFFGDCDEMIIAGDDDQAIFEWSGADIETFLNLAGDRHVLKTSFRLPSAVYDVATRLVQRIRNRSEKLWSPHEDNGEGIVRAFPAGVSPRVRGFYDRMRENDGQSWMLLARNRYLLKEQEVLLRNEGIPYLIHGRQSVNKKEMLAIRGYTDASKGREISSHEAAAFYHLLQAKTQVEFGYKVKLSKIAPEKLDWNWLVENGGLLIDRGVPWFEAFKNLAPERKNYYRALLRHGYKVGQEPKVNCSTIHAVKGGEADHVLLLDEMSGKAYRSLTEGESKDRDAEHRVAYVAATRAKKSVNILQTAEPLYYDYPVAAGST